MAPFDTRIAPSSASREAAHRTRRRRDLLALPIMVGTGLALCAASPLRRAPAPAQPVLTTREAPVLTFGAERFRDLNRNGRLDAYEDWRLSPAVRAQDLVKRLSLAEKAGIMVHGTAQAIGNPMGAGTAYDMAPMTKFVRKGIVNYVTRLTVDPGELARQNNALQALAEATPWGIPLTISSDPRNQFEGATGISNRPSGFSIWPDQIGLAATGDAALVQNYGDVVRREYRATGIQQALSPQADLATEPRWSRISGTFGEDADLASRLVAANVVGLQGSPKGLTSQGVIATVKHWVGYGASVQGWDGHNAYGRYARLNNADLEDHIRPFRAAFRVHAASVMPTYSILQGVSVDGTPLEQVGANFSHQLVTDLLRKREGFDGVVISDWAVTEDCTQVCQGHWQPGTPPVFAMPWGVENLSRTQRFAKAINAGVDEIGGTEESERIVEAVKTGQISMARIDEAAQRILIQKFELGLFENPFVDPEQAHALVGNYAAQAQADDAQARSLVLLQNDKQILPLKPGTKVYLNKATGPTPSGSGLILVADPALADVILIKAYAPYETLHPHYFIGSMQEEGDLGFKDNDPAMVLARQWHGKKPVVAVIHLSRPSILTQLRENTNAIIGEFGVSDAVLLEVLSGKRQPGGRLPFDLPASMAQVEAQSPSHAFDYGSPLYVHGFGLSYR